MVNYDRAAAAYAVHRRAHPQIVRQLEARIGQHHSRSILEIGCGSGNYLAILAGHTKLRCQGVDPSREMLAAARQLSPGLDWLPGRAEQLPLEDATCDFVFSVDVVHHVESLVGMFREAHRVLRAGGICCTVTESTEMIRTRQPLADYFPATVAADIARYPTIPDMVAALQAAGFQSPEESTAEQTLSLTDLAPYRDQAFSCLHLIPPAELARGLQQMEADLANGPLAAASRRLLLWATK